LFQNDSVSRVKFLDFFNSSIISSAVFSGIKSLPNDFKEMGFSLLVAFIESESLAIKSNLLPELKFFKSSR